MAQGHISLLVTSAPMVMAPRLGSIFWNETVNKIIVKKLKKAKMQKKESWERERKEGHDRKEEIANGVQWSPMPYL
jgi:hypothetical protein